MLQYEDIEVLDYKNYTLSEVYDDLIFNDAFIESDSETTILNPAQTENKDDENKKDQVKYIKLDNIKLETFSDNNNSEFNLSITFPSDTSYKHEPKQKCVPELKEYTDSFLKLLESTHF